MLVVGHAGQPGVKGHHDQGELQQGTQQPGSLPRESGLQIKLWEKRETKKQKKVVLICPNSPKMQQTAALWGWLWGIHRRGELTKRKDASCTCVAPGF